jgi:hypothetical protein
MQAKKRIIWEDLNKLKKIHFLEDLNDFNPNTDLILSFYGDIIPNEKLYIDNDKKIILDPIIEDVMLKSNFNIFNLESPICMSENKIRKIGKSFKASPKSIEFLKRYNLNIACLANNHIMDQGIIGVKETIKYLDSTNIKYLGIGDNYENASKPLTINFHNLKIGIFNIAEAEEGRLSNHTYGVNDIENLDFTNTIKINSQKFDLSILVFHGGIEYIKLPPPYIVQLLRSYIDAGIDLIIAHHPHVIQPIEIYKEKFIFYSIGNFFYDLPTTLKIKIPKSTIGIIPRLIIRNNVIRIEILPYVILNQINEIRCLQKQNKLIDILNKYINECYIAKNHIAYWQNYIRILGNSNFAPWFIGSLFLTSTQKSMRRKLKFSFIIIGFIIKSIFVDTKHKEVTINILETNSHLNSLKDVVKRSNGGDFQNLVEDFELDNYLIRICQTYY